MDSIIGQKWHVRENKILKITVTSCGIYRKAASQTFSASFGRSVAVCTRSHVHPWQRVLWRMFDLGYTSRGDQRAENIDSSGHLCRYAGRREKLSGKGMRGREDKERERIYGFPP